MLSQDGKKVRKFTPLTFVLRENKIFYKLLLIEKGDDESLYVKFPRERGYRIKDSHESVDMPSKIIFREKFQSTIFYDPYLSYHAVSGKTHANAFTRQDKSGTRKQVQFFTDTSSTTKKVLLETNQFTPFVSAVLPLNISTYDCIGERPTPFLYNYIEISDNPLFPRQVSKIAPLFLALDKNRLVGASDINLEIYVHRKDVATILPFLKDSDKRNIIAEIKIDHALAKLPFSLVVQALPRQPNSEPSQDIVAFLFNNDKVQAIALN